MFLRADYFRYKDKFKYLFYESWLRVVFVCQCCDFINNGVRIETSPRKIIPRHVLTIATITFNSGPYKALGNNSTHVRPGQNSSMRSTKCGKVGCKKKCDHLDLCHRRNKKKNIDKITNYNTISSTIYVTFRQHLRLVKVIPYTPSILYH